MIKALKSFATAVGTLTIFGTLVVIGLLIYDTITKKPIGGTVPEDEDDEYCPDFIDLDLDE